MQQLKALYANSIDLGEKIQTAHGLVSLSSDAGALPAVVRSHCLRQIAQWTAGQLPKTAPPASGAGSKRKPTPTISADLAAIWRLLATVLSQPLLPEGAAPPPSLLEAAAAAAAACGAAGPADPNAQQALTGLADVLALLRGPRYVQFFRPTLEHCAAMCDAALSLAAAGSTEAGDSLAESAMTFLLAAIRAQPSSRRSFQAVTPRLLPGLSAAAFLSQGGRSQQLAGLARTILHESLLHPENVGPLADVAAALAGAPDGKKDKAAKDGKGKDGESTPAAAAPEARAAARSSLSFHSALFEWVAAAAASEEETLRRGGLGLAAWLVASYGAAASGDVRRASAAGASTSKPKGSTADAAPRGGISPGFAIFAALSGPVVELLGKNPAGASGEDTMKTEERRSSKKSKKAAGTAGQDEAHANGASPASAADSWPSLAHGQAALLRSCSQAGFYRPAADTTGYQLSVLKAAAGAVLPLAGTAAPASRAAAAAVLDALIALDNRPVLSHLPSVWSLCWAAAGKGAPGPAVVARLAATHAELRSVGPFLEALVQGALATTAESDLKSAAAVLSDPEVVRAVEVAMSGIPTGQAASLIRTLRPLLAVLLAEYAAGDASRAEVCDAAADLLAAALGALRVHVSAAAQVAVEAAELAVSAAAALADKARAVSGRPDSAASMLSLYVTLLRVHVECCGLQPDLPQLDAIRAAITTPVVPPPQPSERFLPPGTEPATLPHLAEQLKGLKAKAKSSARLDRALRSAIELRLWVLGEIEARSAFTCALSASSAAAAAQPAPGWLGKERSALGAILASQAGPGSSSILGLGIPQEMDEGYEEAHVASLSRVFSAIFRGEDSQAAATAAVRAAGGTAALSGLLRALTESLGAAQASAASCLAEAFENAAARFTAEPEAPATASKSSKKRQTAPSSADLDGPSAGQAISAASSLMVDPAIAQALATPTKAASAAALSAVSALLASDARPQPRGSPTSSVRGLIAALLPAAASFSSSIGKKRKPSESVAADPGSSALDATIRYLEASAGAGGAVEGSGALLAAAAAATVGPAYVQAALSSWAARLTDLLDKARSKDDLKASSAARLMSACLLAAAWTEVRDPESGRTAAAALAESSKEAAQSLARSAHKFVEWAATTPSAAPAVEASAGIAFFGSQAVRQLVAAGAEGASGLASKAVESNIHLLSALTSSPTTSSDSRTAAWIPYALHAIRELVGSIRGPEAPAEGAKHDGGQVKLVFDAVMRALAVAGEALASGPSPVRPNYAGDTRLAALAALSSTAGASGGNWATAYPVRRAALEAIQALVQSHPGADGSVSSVALSIVVDSASAVLASGSASGREELAASQALLVALEAAAGPQQYGWLRRAGPRLAPILIRHVTCRAVDMAAQCPEALAAVTGSLRALESLAARDGIITLKPAVVADAAAAAATMARGLAGSSVIPAVYDGSMAPPSGMPGLEGGAGAFGASCGLLGALCRHRPSSVRRCAGIVTRSLGGLYAAVLGWDVSAQLAESPGGSDPCLKLQVQCAEELARALEALASRDSKLGRYCAFALADHVTYAEVAATVSGVGQTGSAGGARAIALRRPVLRALRQGAYHVYDACGPRELQETHISLGSGFGGGLRRNALATFRTAYEREFKYGGKV